MSAPATAVNQQIVWKNAEMFRFAVALVTHALAAGGEFTTDIVPDAERGSGPGIAGSVVELLKNASVLAPVGITQHGVWYPKRQKSSRANCNARYLCVYTLTSREVAVEFLRRQQGAAPRHEPLQQEMI